MNPEDIIIAVTTIRKDDVHTFSAHVLYNMTQQELVEQEEAENPGSTCSVLYWTSFDFVIYRLKKENIFMAEIVEKFIEGQ